MFGYITPRTDQLTGEQKDRYQAVYCGLCQALGELSGGSGRLLLSHDMTFLALLLGSLEEPTETEMTCRCSLHPMKERRVIRSRAVNFAAKMNLFLMDMKCEDQIRDDGSRVARAERKRLENAVRKIMAEYPGQTSESRGCLEKLWNEEMKAYPDPDRLGNLSGAMLGAIFVPDWAADIWHPALRQIGEGLGRFVYWMDAWEDKPRDRRKRRFNPLDRIAAEYQTEEEILSMLEIMIGEAAQVFEALPLEKDLELLRNVLYSGVWQKYDLLRKRREKKE